MASLAHGATHKGIKHSSLRDDKRDFDDEENESLYVERHLMRHTHTGEEGYFCETKKNISQRKKKMCVWRIFFFSLFFRVLLVYRVFWMMSLCMAYT